MKFNNYFKLKTIKTKDISNDQKKNRKQQIMIICIILLIGITFFSGVSIGKAVHNTSIKSNTEIAKPILEVEKASEIIITEENNTGEYHFTVKNYNDAEEVSQVDLQYYIEILDDNIDKAIEYQLYKENEKLDLQDNQTQKITLSKDTKEEQNYILKVEYHADKNTIGDIIDEIQVKVHSEQLKI